MRGALAFLAAVACGNDRAVYTDLGQSMTYIRSGLDRLSHVGVSRSSSCSLRCAYTYGFQNVPSGRFVWLLGWVSRASRMRSSLDWLSHASTIKPL